MDMQKVVRKLFDKAASTHSKHEAEAAILKAQELMAKYGIQDIGEENDIKYITLTCKHTGNRSFRRLLAKIIADNFRVKNYLLDMQVTFFGRENDVLTAKQAFEYTYSFICRESGRICRKMREDFQDTTGVVNSYSMGWKNGMTLALQDVDWQTEGYNEVSISYTAIAKYSAVASGTKTSGYLATGTFTGEAVKQTAGKNTYTIVYEGEQIVVPFNFAPIIIAGAVVAGCIVAAVVLWRLRRNVTIYTLQQGVPELYAKVRVSPKNPVLDLSRITDAGVRLVFDKRFVKSLYDQKVFVIGRFTNYRINITGSLVQELPAQQKEEASASQEENTSSFDGGEGA